MLFRSGALEESASDVETVDSESKELMDDGTPLGKDMTVLLPVRLVDELSLSGKEVGAEVIDPEGVELLAVLESEDDTDSGGGVTDGLEEDAESVGVVDGDDDADTDWLVSGGEVTDGLDEDAESVGVVDGNDDD